MQKRKAVENAGNEVQVMRFDGVTAQPADVLDECRSLALLAPYKIVIVDDADQFITPKRFQIEEDEAETAPKKPADVAEAKFAFFAGGGALDAADGFVELLKK